MTRSSGIAASSLGIALLALLLLLAFHAHRVQGKHMQQVQRLHAAWRERNCRALLAVGTVGRLSVQEQTRLDRAGEDSERMRQVMVEIHEERLANAGKDLDDAEQRKVELEGTGGYKVYATQAQPGDLVGLANQDEWTATSLVSRYSEGLRRTRAWLPTSFEEFAAAGAAPVAVVARADPPPPATRPKPDPRVSMPSSPGKVSRTGPVKGMSELPMPAAGELVDSARNPAMTVYPDEAAIPSLEGAGDLARKQRAEEQIRDVLQHWAQAMMLNDPAAEAAAYAPHMARYFLRTNVDKAFVQADKEAYLRRGNRTASFRLEEVAIENETDTTADVRLIKDVTWEQGPHEAEHRLIRSELWLGRTADGWKITGERDFR